MTTPSPPPTSPWSAYPPRRTRLDRMLPKEAATSPTPDFVPVLLAVLATALGVLVFAFVWTHLNNPSHSSEVYNATRPVAAFAASRDQAGQVPRRLRTSSTAQAAEVPRTAHNSERMPNFALATQYGETKRLEFPRKRPVVLAVGDREGARYVEDWIKPLRRRYADAFGVSFDVSGVADLSDVPPVARSMVVLVVRERTEYPVMLDWRGELARDLDVNNGELAVFVVTAEGHIHQRLTGRATEPRLRRLTKAIDELLARH